MRLRHGPGAQHRGVQPTPTCSPTAAPGSASRTAAISAILVEGDKRLFNQYGVMVVNPAKFPHVKAAQAQKFVDWVTRPAGQATIAAYKIGGEQLFFPNANANANANTH